MTPLILAVISRRPGLVPVLLQCGARSGMRDAIGRSAADWAAVMRENDAIKELRAQ